MGAQPGNLNKMEREAVCRIRELFAEGREASVAVAKTDEDFVKEWSELALYPEKPLLSFVPEEKEEDDKRDWYPKQENMEFLKFAEKLRLKPIVRRLITCGGVDDGKSTLIGKILYETKSSKEREAISRNPMYLRKDGTVDYALLAGTTEEEAKQGITVQVSYSVFDWEKSSFLMADVPGHEEYTRNMAYAASKADTAIIMIGANKGIVPQTRRHTRICYFMGIRSMIFAVNKMDMVSFDQEVFKQLTGEIAEMMDNYPKCTYKIVPVAAKSGVNITERVKEMPWYKEGSLLKVLEQSHDPGDDRKNKDAEYFCMPVQRICKSSQMKDAVIKKRVIQGEVISGHLTTGEEIFVYPTGQRAEIAGIYYLNQNAKMAEAGDPIGVELDREIDVARGYILTKEDVLTSTDCVEADILWTSDSRLTQGKRYQVKIGTDTVTAVVTKICYQIDVNTGEHRYAEHLTKNALARCELCFSKQITVTCEKDNRRLGTLQLFDREMNLLAAYGNVIQTISEDAWKEDVREVIPSEREFALGQKAGMIWFEKLEGVEEYMNFVEHYLLRMGFHTIQLAPRELDIRELQHIKMLLNAGLIVLLPVGEAEQAAGELLEEKERIFDYRKAKKETKDRGILLKKIKQWASELI